MMGYQSRQMAMIFVDMESLIPKNCQRRKFFDRTRRSEMTHIAGHPTAGISAGGTV